MITTVVITGASSGIGAATARRFSGKNTRLVLVARRRDKLEALAQELTQASVFELDVTSRNDVQKTFAEIGPIDILVNNAGGAFGLDRAQEANLADWEQSIDVNINGLVYCTHAVLPGMVKRNRGHILNLGSTAGAWPYPGGNVYCGTKAFVHQFSLSLRADLLGTNVRVTCIEPGLLGGTEFSLVRFRGDASKAKNVYEKTHPLQAEDVADVIHYCATLPPHVNINTIEMMPTVQAFGPLLVNKG